MGNAFAWLRQFASVHFMTEKTTAAAQECQHILNRVILGTHSLNTTRRTEPLISLAGTLAPNGTQFTLCEKCPAEETQHVRRPGPDLRAAQMLHSSTTWAND